MYYKVLIFIIVCFLSICMIQQYLKSCEKFTIDDNYFFHISRKPLISCSYDLENKTIGWINDIDVEFINAIIHGHRMNPKNITLLKIKPDEMNDVDCVITLVKLNSNFHKEVLWNSSLYVDGFEFMDINRVRLFFPNVEEFYGQVMDFFVGNESLKIASNSKKILIPRIRNNIEQFIDYNIRIHPDLINPDYACFNEPLNENRAACNSPYDAFGIPKKQFTVWDKKCQLDTDCPYFKANQLYDNSRGGCIKPKKEDKYGTCEVPVGVKLVGFSKVYDKDKYRPFCYNCDLDEYGDCCHKKTFPDYAFPNDYEERRSNDMITYIQT